MGNSIEFWCCVYAYRRNFFIRIKVALLTTLLGLIAACILQFFYNYIVSKIDSMVVTMEDSSISLLDILTAYNKK